MIYHKPVLVKEVLEYLAPKSGGVYVDVTFGGGGHTRAILESDPTITVYSFDWDKVALEMNAEPLQAEFGDRFHPIWANFSLLERKLKELGVRHVDGILADFGTSQYQLTERAGFSFYKDSELDMRMAPSHQKTTAASILNYASADELATIFFDYGQEPRSRLIARAIVEKRALEPFASTKQLATLIEKLLGWQKKGIHPATRVFQALRIVVNRELDNIKAFLPAALRMLKPGGRLVCISFHSIEDSIVKHFFKDHTRLEPRVEIITPRVVVPTPEEQRENPSSRSSKLRCAEKK